MNGKEKEIVKKHSNNQVDMSETKHGIKILNPSVKRTTSRNGVIQVQPC